MASFQVQLIDARYATFNQVVGNQHNVYPLNANINVTSALDILPYAEGASWNPELVCLQDTRREILDDIWDWIYSAGETKTAEILWLCDVAGAGKSAIAHTVAQKCFHKGILASSFFFDRSTPDRRSPIKLFSTIARDLVRLNIDLVRYITQILENDRSVASAGQSRQFDELILNPVCQQHIGGPVVIVIDGLDEGCDRGTLSILRNRVPKLPGTFRILVTSRPTDNIRTDLLNAGHVRYRSLDIQGNINQRDIALYIRDRLHYISERRQLSADWPGQQRIRDFTQQAEGLFVWASTVSEYLLTAVYPDKKLSTLLYDRNLGCLPAEAKMNALYAEVLSTCDWEDDDFVHDYMVVIGTIMAAKTPLSSSALRSLHREHLTLDVKEILRPLSSVLTGFFDEGHPIGILHLSFHDFLTYRAQSSSVHERFQVNEREHSQQLALLSLRVLNEDLTSDIPGTGYLNGQTPESKGIPQSDGSQVTEVLWYACRFWAKHIIEVEGPVSPAFLGPLRQFLLEKRIIWMEVLYSRYPFQTLYGVREWLQETFPSESALIMAISGSEYSSTLFELSTRMSYMDRREDALEAIQEAVDIYRQLAADCPTAFNATLASCLGKFSNRLSSLKRREEALEAIVEAVDLYQQLEGDYPNVFNESLANSLNNLSNCLSDLGRGEEALKAILEAVDLCQRLATDFPAAFNKALAFSLGNLSNRLSSLGRREEALEAIVKAVDLYQQLEGDYPNGFNESLANSLNNLSNCLSDLGRGEDALKAIVEAVDLYRRLAADRPAAFNETLASSINNLSSRLLYLGRRKEALKAIQEAVDLRRRLATDRPATFSGALAGSLNNHSICLSDLGRGEEALKAILEAVDLFRQLAADRPATSNANLASSLANLSNCLSAHGRREEALEVILEALNLRRQLAAGCPAVINTELANLLNNLALHLLNLGRREDAWKAFLEALDLYKQLAEECPAAFNAVFTRLLDYLSNHLSDLAHRVDALEVIQEALNLYRKFAADCPAAFSADLTNTLNNLSIHLSDLGHQHQEEALGAEDIT